MFTPEQLAKAKMTKSAEELFAYANEIGAPMNEDEAKVFFEQWSNEGELADEELENVSGGSLVDGCSTYSSDPPHYLITTSGNSCYHFYVRPGWESDSDGCCNTCGHRSISFTPMYCEYRTYGNDPCKKKKD